MSAYTLVVRLPDNASPESVIVLDRVMDVTVEMIEACVPVVDVELHGEDLTSHEEDE